MLHARFSSLGMDRALAHPRGRLNIGTPQRPGKLLDSSEFRRILGHWSTGVAVVTSRQPDGRPCGLTANAVSSLSLDPPLVLACIELHSDTHDCILGAGVFAVSFLRHDQERLARHFADPGATDKFDGIAFREERTGAPILADVLAWVDCALWRACEGGDHTIFLGEVRGGGATDALPLLYYRGGYGRFTP